MSCDTDDQSEAQTPPSPRQFQYIAPVSEERERADTQVDGAAQVDLTDQADVPRADEGASS